MSQPLPVCAPASPLVTHAATSALDQGGPPLPLRGSQPHPHDSQPLSARDGLNASACGAIAMNKTEYRLVGERTFCVLLLAFSLGILYLAYQIAGLSSINSAGAFPLGVSIVMLLSALTILLGQFRKHPPQCQGWIDACKQFTRQHFPRRTLIFAALAIGYLAAIQWISFYLSTFLFLVLSMVYLRNGRIVGALLSSALLLSLIYLLFTLAFSVYLP